MFMSDNKKVLYIIIGLFVISGLMGMTRDALIATVFTLPAVLVAITFHEFAHAYAATKLGDDTPMMQGRLNLNPISHIDPIGFVLLLFAGFGWGKPVQINPRNFNRKYSMSAGEAIVSVAGPAMNFILAIVFSIVYGVLYKFAYSFLLTQAGGILLTVLTYMIITNLGLGIFNLIPLPPLDGSKILMNFLPFNARKWFMDKEQLFYIIFLVIWITGLTSYIISPILNFLYKWLIGIVLIIFGV